MTPTRGERNNNPGNIEHSPAFRWRGELPPDPAIEPRFARFDTGHNGIRALARNLLTYYRKHRLSTVMDIIYRWAPAGENNTGAYVQHVANQLGVRIQDPLDLEDPQVLRALTRAIIVHENGRCVYEDDVIAAAVCDALDAQTEVPSPPLPEPKITTAKQETKMGTLNDQLRGKMTDAEYDALMAWLDAEAHRRAQQRAGAVVVGAAKSWTVRLNALAVALVAAWPQIEPHVVAMFGAGAAAKLVAAYGTSAQTR